MASDYESITKHNERYLGLDTKSRRTQISMYSDSTHFIYEILQNADDYGATEVVFNLSKGELVIEHNGEPFAEENVKAITYFGFSTSEADRMKTGHFGVGFKSVFAFTASPVIHSGDEGFQIYGLYRVRAVDNPPSFQKKRTRIVLPFNHEVELPDYVENHVSAKDAYKKIARRLAGLNMNTLLFTKNIRDVKWQTTTHQGEYHREDRIQKGCRWASITDGSATDKYLIFSRTPVWRDQEYKPVEIAFLLDEKNQLTLIDDYLYVLFSTAQETHFQFILNGPFRTNPSRETIDEESPFNIHLIREVCELFKDLLFKLRDMKILSTQSLAVLPNPEDKLRSFYEPIRETILECFKNQELVPTIDKGFASAGKVALGPNRLCSVIGGEELGFLSDGAVSLWAKGARPHSRADIFLQSLGLISWSWAELQDALDVKFGFGLDGCASNWLSERPDKWMTELYLLLGEAVKKEDCDSFTVGYCDIIRVLENGEETHVAGKKAFFPRGRGYKELPQVKQSILGKKGQKAAIKIEESLHVLGVTEIGDKERVDLILETYYGNDAPPLTEQENLDHIESFIQHWKKEGRAWKFESLPIFFTSDDTLQSPGSCYIDWPSKKTGLALIYENKKCPLQLKKRLWDGYRQLLNEGFYEFAEACGVESCLPIEEVSTWDVHPHKRTLRQDYNRYGVRFTSTSIDSDFSIEGLSLLLQMRSREINRVIWNTLSKADSEVLEASFRPNSAYPTRTDKSSLVITLSNTAWIPDKRGSLKKPSAISKGQLHSSFKYDNRNGWLDAIGFGEEARKTDEEYLKKKEMAEELGVPVELADYINSLPEDKRKKEVDELKAYIKRKDALRKKQERIKQDNVSYHDALGLAFSVNGKGGNDESDITGGNTRNPARRRQKTREEINAAIENEGRTGSRYAWKFRKKWKGKNDSVRTALANWYGGRCQICGKTFIQRSGEPYFEGLYLVPFTTAEWIDRVGNVLCLCPWHSAKFQYGAKEFGGDVVQSILNLKISAEGGNDDSVLQMKLCGQDVQIKFKENHLLDLQEMIKASQSSAQSNE